MDTKLTKGVAELDKVTENIKDKLHRAYASFLEIGRLLNQIQEQDLYKAKYPTFEEYIDKEIEFARATCYQFKRIAKLVEMYKMDKLVNLGYKKMLLISTAENQAINLVKDTKIKEKKKNEFMEKLKNVTVDMSYDQVKNIFVAKKKDDKKSKSMTKSYTVNLLKDVDHSQIVVQCDKEYIEKLFRRLDRMFNKAKGK